MRRITAVGTLVGLAWLAASPVDAEESPLAAAARKERERRAKLEDKSGKVVTETDLAAGRPPGQPAPAASPAPESAGSGDAAGAQAEGQPAAGDAAAEDPAAVRRAEIQSEIDAQVERIRAVRKQVELIERELADNVAPSLGPRRAQLTQMRDDGNKAIAEIEARIAELQAEAAKLGVSVSRPAE